MMNMFNSENMKFSEAMYNIAEQPQNKKKNFYNSSYLFTVL